MSFLNITSRIISALSLLFVAASTPSHCGGVRLSHEEICNPAEYIGYEVIVTLSAIPVPSPHGNLIDSSHCPSNVHISFELADEARSLFGNEFECAVKFDAKSKEKVVEFTARAFVEDYTKSIKEAPHLMYMDGDLYYLYIITEVMNFQISKRE